MKHTNKIIKPFDYTPSHATDITKTFARVRKQVALDAEKVKSELPPAEQLAVDQFVALKEKWAPTLTHLTLSELLKYRHDPVSPELLDAMWKMLDTCEEAIEGHKDGKAMWGRT